MVQLTAEDRVVADLSVDQSSASCGPGELVVGKSDDAPDVSRRAFGFSLMGFALVLVVVVAFVIAALPPPNSPIADAPPTRPIYADCTEAPRSMVAALADRLSPGVGGLDHAYIAPASLDGESVTLIAAWIGGFDPEGRIGVWGLLNDGGYVALNEVAAQSMSPQSEVIDGEHQAQSRVTACMQSSLAQL